MTVLSACKTAGLRLTGVQPVSVFSVADTFGLELADAANEAAKLIIEHHEWQALSTLHEIVGDGTTVAFPLPGDYHRMPIDGDLYSTRSLQPLCRAHGLNEWLEYEIEPVTTFPGVWIIIGDKINIKTPLSSGERVKFYYQRKTCVRSVSGADKSAFEADSDAFVLSERVLTLGIMAMWYEQKGLDPRQAQERFQDALFKEAARDRAPGVLKTRPGYSASAEYAYPRTIAR